MSDNESSQSKRDGVAAENASPLPSKKKVKTSKTSLRSSWESIVNLVLTLNIAWTQMKMHILEAMMTDMDMAIGNTLLRMIQTVIACTSSTETNGCQHGIDYYIQLEGIQDSYKELFPSELVQKSIPSLLRLIKAIHLTPPISRSTDSTDSSTSTSGTYACALTDRVDAKASGSSPTPILNIATATEKPGTSQSISCNIPLHTRTLKGDKNCIQESTVKSGSYIIQLKIMPFKQCLQEDKNRWWTTAMTMMTSVVTEGEDMMDLEYLNRLIKKLERRIKEGENYQSYWKTKYGGFFQ